MKDLNYAVLENLTAAKRGIFLYHSFCIDNLDSMHMTVIYSQYLGLAKSVRILNLRLLQYTHR